MSAPTLDTPREPTGDFVVMDGERLYRIASFDRMPPFLMSLPSDTDLWMFVASSGGLTAGRVDAEGSLFPYETVDKLYVGHHHTGPITVVRVRVDSGSAAVWEPLSGHRADEADVERNLYKNTTGNAVTFEEVHRGLQLGFRYRWSAADAFGLVRTATITNLGSRPVTLSLLDGLRNVLPFGARLALYQQSSSLIDAYKRVDVDAQTGLAIFSLTARIVDRAEAAESLRANTVWSRGLAGATVHLSGDAVDRFRRGDPVPAEHLLTGQRGNFLLSTSLKLDPGTTATWQIAADAGRSHVQIAALRELLMDEGDVGEDVESALADAGDNLARIVASSDGMQMTAQAHGDVHHFANVLYNTMRGGVFANGHLVPTSDFEDFVATRNRAVTERHRSLLTALPETLHVPDLLRGAARAGDANFERLAHEYLPLYFGRRHGDPSRPWNRFSIRIRNGDGSRALRYEGNWRDIFQNWEALSFSFPAFLPGMVSKFVNASTVDGFNPYRITRDGLDWEIVDPDDPWSYIGYWGDHQIIYLLKLLEGLSRLAPDTLGGLLRRDIFSYADVPYRIAPYEEMLADPHVTIAYDEARAADVEKRVATIGTDGKLLAGSDGSVKHVNLIEKLLVPVLSKLSNLVPDGGIWMNTQRPEWNDANNALVGRGVSMVTLCYLRRYLTFLHGLVEERQGDPAPVSREVVAWMRRVHAALDEGRATLAAERVSDRDRRRLMDALGRAFSAYRDTVYASGLSGREPVAADEIAALCDVALEHLDHAIAANRREDGLYHAYNLLELRRSGEAGLGRLYEMLEGQVAALSSGALDAGEAERVMSALFESRMYRADQRSFMLYPARDLPAFLDRNAVPAKGVRGIPLLEALLRAGDPSIVERDATGTFRFHADFSNAHDVAAALVRLGGQPEWSDAVARDRDAVLALFEQVFDHHSFTGRSGTMYGYEGLGCIYWHMVAKLLLAVQEIAIRAVQERRPADVQRALARSYYRLRSGLGFEKTVMEYGAFPADPYSHTPAHTGAQQPGMTGQVKEEILTRLGELGVRVENGLVSFEPVLLRASEFLPVAGTFRYLDAGGVWRSIEISAGALAFTFCQVPVVFERNSGAPWVQTTDSKGRTGRHEGCALNATLSRALLMRDGTMVRIDVGVPEKVLLQP